MLTFISVAYVLFNTLVMFLGCFAARTFLGGVVKFFWGALWFLVPIWIWGVEATAAVHFCVLATLSIIYLRPRGKAAATQALKERAF
jgi:hypothetical protein